PTFDIADDEMEFEVGIHSEPGRRRGPVRPAQELVDELLSAILGDLHPKPESQVLLHAQGLKVARSLVGNYTTALEMAGASLTVTLLDEELKSLWDAPVHTAAL